MWHWLVLIYSERLHTRFHPVTPDTSDHPCRLFRSRGHCPSSQEKLLLRTSCANKKRLFMDGMDQYSIWSSGHYHLIGPDQNRAEQNRPEQTRPEQNRTERTGTDWNGPERTGTDRNRTEQNRPGSHLLLCSGSLKSMIKNDRNGVHFEKIVIRQAPYADWMKSVYFHRFPWKRIGFSHNQANSWRLNRSQV